VIRPTIDGVAAERESSPLTGAQPFGKYYLLDRIGAGGMAEVFRAVVIGLEGFQRTLVIKRMLPQLSQDGAFVQMFIDEAKLSGLLSHPNVVQIFEFGKVDESFFIAMEHVDGKTLSAVQAKLAELERRPPVAACLEIARQVCSGLQYAHSLQSPTGQPLGVVHRDISPSNLMLSFHGGVKILDFGIARVAEELRDVQTQVGTVKGKVAYMAPEQIRLERVDGRCDIFALGIVLHETLTGRRLFRATAGSSAAHMVLESVIPTPSSLNPAVPAEVDQIVMRALERNPGARFQTADEMGEEIERVLFEMRASPHEPEKLLRSLFPQPASHSGEAMLPAIRSLRVPGEVGSEPSLRTPSSGSGYAAGPSIDVEIDGIESPPKRRRTWLALGAAVALAIAGGAVALRARVPARLSGMAGPAATAAQAAVPPTSAATSPTQPAPPGPAAAVRVSFDSSPQEAEVVREDSGQVVGRTPVTIALPQAREVITFRFDKPGHRSLRYKVIPDLDKSVRVDLLADSVVGPPLSGAARPVPLPPHRHHLARGSPAGGPPPAEAAVQGSDCVLSVASFPWTELWIDGRDTGQRTPVVHYPTACGPHKLALKRRDLKLDRVESVTLAPGHELKQHYELGDDYGD
jgi:serine/threonine protein kinase